MAARLQIFDLRNLVDSPGDYPRDCRPGTDYSYSRAYDRDYQQIDTHLTLAGAGTRTRTNQRRDCQEDGHTRVQGTQGSEDRPGTNLFGDSHRGSRRFALG